MGDSGENRRRLQRLLRAQRWLERNPLPNEEEHAIRSREITEKITACRREIGNSPTLPGDLIKVGDIVAVAGKRIEVTRVNLISFTGRRAGRTELERWDLTHIERIITRSKKTKNKK